MKSLKPSMRENKRYLLIRGKNLKKNVKKAILEGIGVLGLSRVGFSWIKSDGDSAIVAVNREALNEVRASFVIFPEKISVERVSGSLKKLKK
jgi:RNase P/RNase MRP subunit POP5